MKTTLVPTRTLQIQWDARSDATPRTEDSLKRAFDGYAITVDSFDTQLTSIDFYDT